MRLTSLREKLKRSLEKADIRINGDRPWDIVVHNDAWFARVLAEGSLGLGESYMDGWWDCQQLDGFFYRILRAKLDESLRSWTTVFDVLKARLFNPQKVSRAFQIGQHHYDIGNDLYQCMLDRRMIYSCAYWPNAATLDEAQEAKLDLICHKLQLTPGMKVLDIGCGWGGTARFAAERYGVEVTGITVSQEQDKCGRELCTGLPVDILLADYRSIQGTYDRIISIGMFEHVGYKNYLTFIEKVRSLMKENGLFLLQTIGGNHSVKRSDPWIGRYIFPNSMLPSAAQISRAIEKLFVLEDWHSFGADYEKTLMAWYGNIQRNWDRLKHRYDNRFYRMWTYYLLSCAGAFRARTIQLWQVILSPLGVSGGYRAPR